MKVKKISLQQFRKKFNLPDLNPWRKKLFNETDFKILQEESGMVRTHKKLQETILQIVPFVLKHPLILIKDFKEILRSRLSQINNYYKASNTDITETFPFNDYKIKSQIIAAFKPKSLLEIGTATGWGIAAFKSVLPSCKCYTMNPKVSKDIGVVHRRKKIKVKQIWADSTKFDFNKIGKVDVSYIDGNHTYPFVYSDLVNCNKITKKLIILDDYIPSSDEPREPSIRWATYFLEVVKAVDDFLKNNPKAIKEAYWIRNTRICALIK